MTRPMKLFTGALRLSLGGGALLSATAVTAGLAQSQPAQSHVAKFVIAKMTCGSCPIIVNKAMSAVRGVQFVAIDADRKVATVRYDPKVTSIAAIAAASANAGYPARPIG